MPRIALARTLGLLALLAGARAHAVEPEPVRLDYRVDESCPDADAFERAVFLRTNRARAAREHEPARTFHVTVTLEGNHVRGALAITDAQDTEQTSSARAVDGTSCSEVFDALVLFAALSVDANASSSPHALVPALAPPPSVTNQRAAPPAATGRHRGDGLPARRFRLVIGFDAGAVSAGLEQPAVLFEPFAETRWQRALETGFDVSPTLRATLSMFAGNSTATETGYANLRWTLARLDACPIALVLARSLRLRPCASFSGGFLRAAGREIAQPKTRYLTWWAPGAALRAEWTPSAFGLELTGGLEAPLQRAELYFEPDSQVYRPPAVFERITLGASYHFL